MSVRLLILIASLFCLSLIGEASALAQSVYPGGGSAPANRSYVPPTYARGRPEIVITPRRPLYRRCVDWLELQYRPSGPVLYPQYRCWWVR